MVRSVTRKGVVFNMKIKRKKVAIIKFTDMPDNIRNDVKDWLGFSNDCLLPLRSEFTAKDLSYKGIKDYHKHQVETNDYKDDLDQFIKDYNLNLEMWLLEQRFNFKGVSEIFIEISW